MKGKDTTTIMKKTTIEYVAVNEKKKEWQRVCFVIANLISLMALFVKIEDEYGNAKVFGIVVTLIIMAIFVYFIFGKIDNVE